MCADRVFIRFHECRCFASVRRIWVGRRRRQVEPLHRIVKNKLKLANLTWLFALLLLPAVHLIELPHVLIQSSLLLSQLVTHVGLLAPNFGRLSTAITWLVIKQALFKQLKSLLASAYFFWSDHVRGLLSSLLFALIEYLLTPLLEHDLIFVPVLAELLVDAIDRHVWDGLLGDLVSVCSAEVRFLKVNRGIIERDS